MSSVAVSGDARRKRKEPDYQPHQKVGCVSATGPRENSTGNSGTVRRAKGLGPASAVFKASFGPMYDQPIASARSKPRIAESALHAVVLGWIQHGRPPMDETELSAAMEQVNAELHSRAPLGAKRHFFTGPGAMNAKTRAAAEQFLREGMAAQAAAERVYQQETGGYPLPPAPNAA